MVFGAFGQKMAAQNGQNVEKLMVFIGFWCQNGEILEKHMLFIGFCHFLSIPGPRAFKTFSSKWKIIVLFDKQVTKNYLKIGNQPFREEKSCQNYIWNLENNRFFEKKLNGIWRNTQGQTEQQQSSRFGGPSLSHGKIEVMLRINSKTQYETTRPGSTELNNNIY